MFDIAKIDVIQDLAEVGPALSKPEAGAKAIGIQGEIDAPFILVKNFLLGVKFTLAYGSNTVKCKKKKSSKFFQFTRLLN